MSEPRKPIHPAIEKMFPCECATCHASKALYAEAVTNIVPDDNGSHDITLDGGELEASIVSLMLNIAARLQPEHRTAFAVAVQNMMTNVTVEIATGKFDWGGNAGETKH